MADPLFEYARAQSPEAAKACAALRALLDSTLPRRAVAKLWHGAPVWFLGENPVVGYSVNAKQRVQLLFWNGQSFGDPALTAIGKFHAAQVQYGDAGEIDPKAVRRWLRKAAADIWDYRAYFLGQKAKAKAKTRTPARAKVKATVKGRLKG
jgi:hypothetical protein